MKRADIEAVIEAGGAVAIEHFYDEADAGIYTRGKGVVKATPLEVGVERHERYGPRNAAPKRDGVRVRVEEPYRRITRGLDAQGVEELPAGFEVVIPSRQVLRPWGERASRPGEGDDDIVTSRAERYREQDAIRAVFERTGLEGADYAGDTVKIPRAKLAEWLDSNVPPTGGVV